jgi:hypothetical protein
MKEQIEAILALFPEVKWDRWSGLGAVIEIFGWIPRDDGKSDFLMLLISDGEVATYCTSSAKYSAAFANRLNFVHMDCRRVSGTFECPNVVDVLRVKQDTI